MNFIAISKKKGSSYEDQTHYMKNSIRILRSRSGAGWCTGNALNCTWEILDSNPDRNTGYPEVFREFPQSFQAGVGAVPQLGHDCFLSNASNSLHINQPRSIYSANQGTLYPVWATLRKKTLFKYV
jgi:hypothetical protein